MRYQTLLSVNKTVISPVILLAFATCACNKTEDFKINYQYNYYPLETGHYVIYDVDSFTFDNNFDPPRYDTFHYQKMHVIDSSFIDNSGRENFKLIRYQRSDSSQAWFIANVWFGVRTETSLELVEDNQRFIKLIFPPSEGTTWNGNNYIHTEKADNWYLEGWEYEYNSVNKPGNVNGWQFDSTLTILQQDLETLIEKVYAEEQYAVGVGLIYKQLMAVGKQLNISAPWTEPESGFILTMTIREYGMN